MVTRHRFLILLLWGAGAEGEAWQQAASAAVRQVAGPHPLLSHLFSVWLCLFSQLQLSDPALPAALHCAQ